MVIDNSDTKNKCGMNLLKDNLEAQILEIEAQVKVKNSDISDLESMMNNKVQSFKNDMEQSKKIDGETYEKEKACFDEKLIYLK